MIIRVPVSLLFILSCSLILGCASSRPDAERLLGTIGSEPLTLQEFEETYAKNNGGWENATHSSLEDRERFLDLIVKFKLKVLDARSQGIDRDTAVQNEINSYRLSVATSYMLEKELIEPSVREMYDRKKAELRASHILFRVDPNASPKDTLEMYNKAMRIIEKVAHTGFDTLARAYSEDPSASFNNGDLGFFSAGRMVPEFEDASYSLKPGEYTHVPVRTQFGYHIIKVTDRRPGGGSIRLSHILRRFAPDQSDTVTVRDTVWAIYRQIKNGLNFEAAVAEYTEDPGSVHNKGDIGFYERERMPPDIGNELFSLPVDSVAKPYRQAYGYHIFKVTARKPFPPFQDLEKDLRQQYQQTPYKSDYQDYVHDLKKKYRLNFDVSLMYTLTHAFDSTNTTSIPSWSDALPAPMLEQTLFTSAGGRFTVRDFVSHLQSADEFKTTLLTPSNIENIIERITEAKILEQHARAAPQRFPTFAKLMQEYENGILLYRIEQEEVWQKVQVNDSLLRLYYEDNKEKYRWPDRVNLLEVHVFNDSLANVVFKRAQRGEDVRALAKEFTERPGYREKKGEWGLLPVAHNEITRIAGTMAPDSVSAPIPFEGGWSVVQVIAEDNARVKAFEEISGEITSAYQEDTSKAREKEWIEALKKKYLVVLHREMLAEAFKGKPVDKF